LTKQSERLRASLATLTESECELVDALFFSNGGDGMSERECADKLVLSKTAVHARKEKILEKLKNMLENS
jgi:DNA-binding NarL/FixJ family response regulator